MLDLLSLKRIRSFNLLMLNLSNRASFIKRIMR